MAQPPAAEPILIVVAEPRSVTLDFAVRHARPDVFVTMYVLGPKFRTPPPAAETASIAAWIATVSFVVPSPTAP